MSSSHSVSLPDRGIQAPPLTLINWPVMVIAQRGEQESDSQSKIMAPSTANAPFIEIRIALPGLMKTILGPLAQANHLADMPDFNDPSKLGSGKEIVQRLSNLISFSQAGHTVANC